MDIMTESASQRAQRPELWIDRAVRHPLQIPLRYRLQGQQEWSRGETLNLSESGVLFCCEDLLEVNTRVEITFQTTDTPLLSSGTRSAQIVRRVLNTWPETQLQFGARFSGTASLSSQPAGT
jgi:PilZ domain-containing protein